MNGLFQYRDSKTGGTANTKRALMRSSQHTGYIPLRASRKNIQHTPQVAEAIEFVSSIALHRLFVLLAHLPIEYSIRYNKADG